VYIIYPEVMGKNIWDLTIGFILILSCTTTPYLIAFYVDNPDFGPWGMINNMFNLMFLIDIFV